MMINQSKHLFFCATETRVFTSADINNMHADADMGQYWWITSANRNISQASTVYNTGSKRPSENLL